MFSDRGVDVGGLTFGKGRMRFSLEIVEGRPSLVVRGSENYQTVVFDLGKINIRPVAGDPASPTDGDIWYDDTAGLFQFRQEGVTESLSGDNAPVDATYVVSSANATLSAELVLGTDVIMAGTAASRPAAGTAGRLYFSTDTGVLERDNGAAWVDITTTPDSHDHGSAFHSGLTDDDHTQYALLAGRASSQLLRGGTGASETLTLRGTSHATVGNVALNDLGGHVTVGGGTAASELRIFEPSGDGTSYVSFKSPALAGNVDYTLPPDDGDAGEQLQTNGSGVLTWEAAGSGAPTDAQYVTLATHASLSAERVLTGTSDEIVLADGGANGNIVLDFAAGVWRRISTATASASASVDIALTTGYDVHRLIISNMVAATDDQDVFLRLSDDGGVTYEADAGDYKWEMATGGSNVLLSSNGDTEITITGLGVGAGVGTSNVDDEPFNAVIYIYGARTTTVDTNVSFFTSYERSDATNRGWTTGSGVIGAATDNSHIRVIMSSGNITSGQFILEGVKST